MTSSQQHCLLACRVYSLRFGLYGLHVSCIQHPCQIRTGIPPRANNAAGKQLGTHLLAMIVVSKQHPRQCVDVCTVTSARQQHCWPDSGQLNLPGKNLIVSYQTVLVIACWCVAAYPLANPSKFDVLLAWLYAVFVCEAASVPQRTHSMVCACMGLVVGHMHSVILQG